MRRSVFYWGLYDFANSIVLISFLFYFSQWLVVGEGRPAWWYNAGLIVSSLLFILSTPALARRIDSTGKKIGGLRLWSVLAFTLLCATSVITITSHTLDIVAAILYTAGMYTYLMCYLYFTPMLSDLSTSMNRGRISGIGQGFNSAGQVAGLLLTLPFANGVITLFGEPGRAQALLPSVLLFGVLALPLLLLYKDIPPAESTETNMKESPSPLAMLKRVFSYRPLALLLVAYFFFSDALLTFAANFPLYLQEVFAVTDTTKALLTVGILALATVGAGVFGYIGDKRGHRKTLAAILALWCAVFFAMGYITSFPVLVGVTLIAGILYGPVWGISRAMVGQLAPTGLSASSYSYYTVAERFATFIGPATWSVVLLVAGQGAAGYRAAIFSMGILVAIGLLILLRSDERVSKNPLN